METSLKLLRRNIRANLWNGVWYQIGYNFVMPFTGVLAAHLGAGNREYALLSSVPALLSLIAILPAAFLLERSKDQKRTAAAILLFSRSCYLLMAFVPWFPLGSLYALILLVGVYSATSAIVGVAYQAMMGDIIPARYRNRVFAFRNMASNAIGMGIVIAAGWGIDRIHYPYGYTLFFLLGLASAGAETYYFIKLRLPGTPGAVPADLKSAANPFVQAPKATWREIASRPFILFCAAVGVFVFFWQSSWPIYLKVKVDILHADNTAISLDTIAGVIGSMAGFPLFARMADKRGNGFTVALTAMLLGMTPFCWIHAKNMDWIYLYDIVGGLVTAGMNQAIFNRLLELVPAAGRSRAIGAYTTLYQGMAILAPVAGMALYVRLPYWSVMSLVGILRMAAAGGLFLILLPAVSGRIERKRNMKIGV